MSLIVLDAGHGGANPGATYNGRKESEDALALTLAVGSILEETEWMCITPGPQISMSPPIRRHRREMRWEEIILSRSIAIPVLIRTSTVEWRV